MCMQIVKKLKEESGVTLLELILLIVVLAIAMLPLSRLVTMNLKFSSEMTKVTEATFRAQDKMEQIISDYTQSTSGFDSLAVRGYDGDSYTTPVYSDFYHEVDGGYTMDAAIDTGLSNLLNGVRYLDVTVSVSGQGLNNPLELTSWLFER